MRRSTCLLFLLLLASPLLAQRSAAPTGPLAVLDAERSSLRSLVFTATIETPKPQGRMGRSSMKFEFLAPNRYRSEINLGRIEGKIITVADGRVLWSHLTRMNKIFQQDQAEATRRLSAIGPVDPVTALATPSVPLSALFEQLAATTDSRGQVVLTLRSRRTVPNYERLLITLAPDGKTPRQIEAYTRDRRLASRVLFTSYTRNAAVPLGRVEFTVPPGVTPEPIR